MKHILPFLLLLTGLAMTSCGKSEGANHGSSATADPLEQVPDADAAAAEAESISAENADQALADMEKELSAEQ